jgi:hypothetical protein
MDGSAKLPFASRAHRHAATVERHAEDDRRARPRHSGGRLEARQQLVEMLRRARDDFAKEGLFGDV